MDARCAPGLICNTGRTNLGAQLFGLKLGAPSFVDMLLELRPLRKELVAKRARWHAIQPMLLHAESAVLVALPVRSSPMSTKSFKITKLMPQVGHVTCTGQAGASGSARSLV